MRLVRPLISALAAIGLVAGLGITSPAAALPGVSVATWAPASTATIHPGVQVTSDAGQCTANFIYTAGTSVYIGVAAHCFSEGGPTDTSGCDTTSLGIGSPATIEGASQTGTLAYSSWLAMQNADETDPDTCAYNDLALVEIAPTDVASVNPSVPFWGGPTGLDASVEPGEDVYSYGNSSLRLGIPELSPKRGTCLDRYAGDWEYDVYTVSPGIPGDSGSGFLSATGAAFGVLSTLQAAPLAGSNGVGNLAKELSYASSHGFSGVTLVPGTEPFDASRLL
jgi:hypothetical protein